MIVADTSLLVEHLRGSKVATAFLARQPMVIVPAYAAWELWKGAHEPRERDKVSALLAVAGVEPFSAGHAERAGALYRDAQRQGRKPPVMDLLIASHALHRSCALATLDRDYSGIPGLPVVKP